MEQIELGLPYDDGEDLVVVSRDEYQAGLIARYRIAQALAWLRLNPKGVADLERFLAGTVIAQ